MTTRGSMHLFNWNSFWVSKFCFVLFEHDSCRISFSLLEVEPFSILFFQFSSLWLHINDLDSSLSEFLFFLSDWKASSFPFLLLTISLELIYKTVTKHRFVYSTSDSNSDWRDFSLAFCFLLKRIARIISNSTMFFGCDMFVTSVY